MLTGMAGVEPEPGPWQETSAEILRERLPGADAALAAFAVDRPGEPGKLAACVLAVVEQRLASPENPSGRVGYIFSVATDDAYRRRGYSRLCMEATLAWYRERGVGKVDLRASVDAEPLYRSLGFVRTSDPAMRLSM
ncbi:N-acetyltransferase [Phytomonospora endophytica]|nr:N-acetyltransferase [Phytomonospora endophytica]